MNTPAVRTLVIPKVDHEDHLSHIGQEISRVIQSNPELQRQRPEPLSVVASIESAQALWRIGEIAQWKSKHGHLSALLVRRNGCPQCVRTHLASVCSRGLYVRSFRPHWAAGSNFSLPDCADTRIVRTLSRQELLYTRSKILAVARAFGLDAIDMVGFYSTSRAFVEPGSIDLGLR